MKKITKSLMMLAMVLTVGVVMTACGSISKSGNWSTYKNAGTTSISGTYTFAYTGKSYGSFTSSKAAPSVNVNNLKITKTSSLADDGETTIAVYGISNIVVFVPRDVLQVVQKAVDGDVPQHRAQVKYTKNNETSPTVEYGTSNYGTSTKLYSNKEATNLSSTQISLSDVTLARVDMKKSITVTFEYDTLAKKGVKYSFTFKLSKAVLK